MSELALKLIKENKITQSPCLDLGNCGLTEVPMEISELVWLEELSFSNLKEVLGFERNNRNNGPANKISYFRKKDKSNPFLHLTNLRRLWFNCFDGQTSYSPESLSSLKNLKKLEWLDFSNTRTSDISILAELKNLEWLDLSDTKLSNLDPISNLKKLQDLYISGTKVTDLTPLNRLTNLKSLFISRTRVKNLSPLAGMHNIERLYFGGTAVDDLSPLVKVNKLREVNAHNTKITELSPITHLKNLVKLDISDNNIIDLNPLANLIELRNLDISGTKYLDLTTLKRLSNLEYLHIGRKFIFEVDTDLDPLKNLTVLNTLRIKGSKEVDLTPLLALDGLKEIVARSIPISDISPFLHWIRSGVSIRLKSQSMQLGYWRNNAITVDDDYLTIPPAEIVKQGNEAILNYFDEKQKQGIDHLYEAKLLIVGEGGAGKTSLLRRLYQTDKPLPEEAETTKGIAIHRHEFKLDNSRTFRLNVWDFGGQEIYHSTHQFFLTKRSLYVLLDDTRKDNKTVQDEGFKYWLEVVDQLSDHSPLLIFQNEKGGRGKKIDEAGIKGRFDNVKEIFNGNLEFPGTANKLKSALEYYAKNLPHIGEQLPARWVSIRADIETLAEYRPHISLQEYFDLYGQQLPFDREKALFLSRYLHDLGVFLHFQEDRNLLKTIILQNTWATEAVFKMLDDEIVKTALGHFNQQDCLRVWQDSQYADMHAELLALMQKFELCYQLPDAGSETWLAPQLLPPSKPAALASWEQPGDLVLRYRYEFMPKGLVSRLMVRQHRFVSRPDLGWVTGVLFEQDGSELLVEIAPKGGEIILRARGPERKELLTAISADLDALNDSFRLNDEKHHEKVEKLVPCNCNQCREKTKPESFDLKRLLQRKRDYKLKVECPASYEVVDVSELLDGIRSEHLPKWANKTNSMNRPLKIFISYSHAQRDYVSIFKADFDQYINSPELYAKVFADQEIPIGTDWDNFLQSKVANCDVMILLVSQEFMNSQYIQEKEFGAALERLKSDNSLLIAPIYFTPCQFSSDEELARLQFFKPHGDQFDQTQIGAKFAYTDLVKFRETDGQPIPNSNRQHYMMELVKRLKPELQKLIDNKSTTAST
ncbi:COR domain-containing protein [Methylomonas rivi]|uniref:non-specific serine/threonine protein kinase n=1 Tax=Methylomonas rivi TaxID=2952226 RepID=A0ABT1U1N9_9GAMM|nr:COR domain-containing protein [Methylomonas sp. WSC-6]MCQ8127747.1 leucine-rich repeat domain-containing protein [Methylomonas sp. WSC-6]